MGLDAVVDDSSTPVSWQAFQYGNISMYEYVSMACIDAMENT